MPEKACQNPLTSPVWPQKGSCPPGDSSLFLCLGVGRGAIFPNRKNGWRKTRRAGGGALCVVDCRLVNGYVDAREAVWGGVRGAGGQGGLRERVVVSHRGITLRKGARGGRVRRDKGDSGKGGGGGSARGIGLGKGGGGGGGGGGKGGSKKGRAVASSRRIASRKGAGGGRARRETTRRKNAGQKEKGGRGPPYLWYLEFCKIWKPR